MRVLQVWMESGDQWRAFVVMAPSGWRYAEVGRLVVIELGYTIASTGLAACAMYADSPWR